MTKVKNIKVNQTVYYCKNDVPGLTNGISRFKFGNQLIVSKICKIDGNKVEIQIDGKNEQFIIKERGKYHQSTSRSRIGYSLYTLFLSKKDYDDTIDEIKLREKLHNYFELCFVELSMTKMKQIAKIVGI